MEAEGDGGEGMSEWGDDWRAMDYYEPREEEEVNDADFCLNGPLCKHPFCPEHHEGEYE